MKNQINLSDSEWKLMNRLWARNPISKSGPWRMPGAIFLLTDCIICIILNNAMEVKPCCCG